MNAFSDKAEVARHLSVVSPISPAAHIAPKLKGCRSTRPQAADSSQHWPKLKLNDPSAKLRPH